MTVRYSCTDHVFRGCRLILPQYTAAILWKTQCTACRLTSCPIPLELSGKILGFQCIHTLIYWTINNCLIDSYLFIGVVFVSRQIQRWVRCCVVMCIFFLSGSVVKKKYIKNECKRSTMISYFCVIYRLQNNSSLSARYAGNKGWGTVQVTQKGWTAVLMVAILQFAKFD